MFVGCPFLSDDRHRALRFGYRGRLPAVPRTTSRCSTRRVRFGSRLVRDVAAAVPFGTFELSTGYDRTDNRQFESYQPLINQNKEPRTSLNDALPPRIARYRNGWTLRHSYPRPGSRVFGCSANVSRCPRSLCV